MATCIKYFEQMRQSRRKDSRRAGGSSRGDAKSVRSAFVVNMFREFPDRVFSLKQLSSASGGNTREGRYIVRDIVEQTLRAQDEWAKDRRGVLGIASK